ncbi:hypothetical protein WMW72_10805 [Paenibacillus filicis]|uniref:Phage ABA sandwich domain-containing protein n=2 Tax=Paenibacillus filicis TaxID=669464 RepID=A0ABU9DHN3_9BACL
MGPGPELDAALAEALGKPNVRRFRSRYVYDNAGYVNGKPTGPVMGTVDVEEYSTTWSGMELVVEEMHRIDNGERFNLALGWFPNDKEWGADFDEWGVESRAFTTTAPHAVAIAALLALKGDTAHE